MAYPDSFIAYGAQYYRAPTPFPEHWADDLKAAADAGFNTMKFWVQWRANSPRKGAYDFSDLERLMELAGKNHLKVILNTVFDGAPAWFDAEYPDSFMVTAAGRVMRPQLLAYRQTGGCPGPCLNHPEARAERYAFLREAALRFKDHPALLLWDLWNEVELSNGILREPVAENLLCYCGHCRAAFIQWLREKYPDIGALNAAWHGMFGDFDQVELPRGLGVPKPMVDFRMFFAQVCAQEVRLRKQAVREAGDHHPVMVHTVPMPYFNLITTGSDDYLLAKECDMFGCSIGSEPFASAVTASAAPGKPILASEIHAMGGSSYARPVKPDFAAFKRHIFVPLARGMKGFQYWQLRPEVLGNEAPAWGLMDLRGRTNTPAFAFAKRINDALQSCAPALSRAMPKPARIAILNSGKNQIFDWVSSGNIQLHYRSVKGLFDALYGENYNVDILSERQMIESGLGQYRMILTPFPYYMERAAADKLKAWVRAGGHLFSEAFFAGVSDENGCFSEMQPGFGFDGVFGAEEKCAYSLGGFQDAYSADQDIRESRFPLMDAQGRPVLSGFGFMQGFEPREGARVLAAFEDGVPAVVENRYGAGLAVIAGTLMGCADARENAAFLGRMAGAAGVERNAETQDALRVDALYQGEALRFLILSNQGRGERVELRLPALAGKELYNPLTGANGRADGQGRARLEVAPGEMELFEVR